VTTEYVILLKKSRVVMGSGKWEVGSEESKIKGLRNLGIEPPVK